MNEALLDRYRQFLDIPLVLEPSEGPPFTYYTLDLCGQKPSTRSDYIIDGKRGHFRENRCGRGSFGSLEFAGDTTVDVELFGPVSGWIYNAPDAKPPRSYFFSAAPPYPDDLPGLYVLLTGEPYQAGGTFSYDRTDVGVANRS
jgi:hypothetical protein